MKKTFFIFLSGSLLFSQIDLFAQNWVNGGNNLAAIGRLGTTSNQSVAFITGNTERARITNTGNFGIGTIAPITKFHVNGFGSFGNRVTTANSIRAINLADDNAVLRVLRVDASNAPAVELISRTSADGANVAYWDFYTQPSDASFRIRDRKSGGAGLDRVTISGSGYVGVGTTNPQFPLDVRNTSTFGQFKATSGYAGVIIDKSSAGANEYVVHRTAGADKWTEGTIGNNNFSLHNWTNGSDALTVDISNNYVGIGTTAPGAKLDVVGSTTSGTGINTSGYSYGLSSNATYTYGYGVYATSPYLAVYGYAGSGSYGTYGYSNYIGAYGYGTTYGTYGYSSAGSGAYGASSSGTGVYGSSSSGNGVYGFSSSSYGGNFESTDSWGLRASTTNGYYAGVFYGHVYSSDGFITSDKNLKTNIHEFTDAMSIINKLKPENYEFKKDVKYASLHLPKGSHYGLLAQDLEQVLPNLVSEAPHELKLPAKPIAAIKPTADGKPTPVIAETKDTKETTETIKIKAVNYVELIPILVKAIQEQEAKIDALTELVDQLKNSHPEASVKLSGASLSQNSPNPPVANSTRINYQIPLGSATAELIFTNVAGQRMKQVRLDKNSPGYVDVDTSTLISGTYFYTLFVNGKSVDTRKMVVNKF